MGEEKDLLSTLLLELRRGTLTISVLSQMNKPKYGYALVQSLEEKGVAIDPNTLYPLLRRLESQQLLESKWETSGTKPRKYYQRTDQRQRDPSDWGERRTARHHVFQRSPEAG